MTASDPCLLLITASWGNAISMIRLGNIETWISFLPSPSTLLPYLLKICFVQTTTRIRYLPSFWASGPLHRLSAINAFPLLFHLPDSCLVFKAPLTPTPTVRNCENVHHNRYHAIFYGKCVKSKCTIGSFSNIINM